MKNQKNNLHKTILNTLANHLGVESEDINIDDSLADDLHMTPADLTDFAASLENSGVNIEEVDFTEIYTVGELLEAATAKEEIN